MKQRLLESLRRRGIGAEGSHSYALGGRAGDATQVLAGFVDFAEGDIADLFPGLRIPDANCEWLSLSPTRFPRHAADAEKAPALFLQRGAYLVDHEDIGTHSTTGIWLILGEEINRSQVDTSSMDGRAGIRSAAWKQLVEESPLWTRYAPSAVSVEFEMVGI